MPAQEPPRVTDHIDNGNETREEYLQIMGQTDEENEGSNGRELVDVGNVRHDLSE